ncbi:sigma 54 modulation protein/ribosomal protein S30EA [Lentzea aerocolonigenes]|uniref:Sigma 54 modulation protein/ribosomal protein S30EA n=1 Tax=Lentzea aerocolonigenes TaxID=68170 RepID=A0A0F0GCT9_LENAE|nr:HPF/RaiA family ribosome-associated protein [Lentzea aerocolonigenes]KJK34332.1 sigma 54 modulation protein/ribosomal protein S30EA [Lentzea aerocolonigenes]
MSHTPAGAAVIVRRLRLAAGFLASERGWVSERLTALGLPLRSFRDDQIDLEISLKDRQGAGQRLTLECWIDQRPRLHFVATSSERDLPTALSEVCDELIRQVDEAKTRTDPRSNRALRLVPGLPKHE